MASHSPAPWPALRVTYHVTAANPSDLEARVESLLLEQTVELPRAALHDKFVLENIVGRLASVEAPADLVLDRYVAGQPGQRLER